MEKVLPNNEQITPTECLKRCGQSLHTSCIEFPNHILMFSAFSNLHEVEGPNLDFACTL